VNLEIYHQLGHNYTWNLQSLRQDQTGQGLIFAPRFMSPQDIAEIDTAIVQNSIFDPQFFLPRTALGELSKYKFFPDKVADGFITQDYSPEFAKISAHRCVKYQSENDFRYVVIPTRWMSGMPSTFVDNQQELFVTPFLEALAEQQPRTKTILQLVLNRDMIKDHAYSDYLLNWITGLDTIEGVYLIMETRPRAKQIADADFLLAYLSFIDHLVQNQLHVVLGYLNTEAFLLSVASPRIVTMGVYETTRMFDIGNFEKQDKSRGGGPRPRLYTSNLLQWIDHSFVRVISDELGVDPSFYHDNIYRATMFEPTYQWHFTKPELYKHAFVVMSEDLEALSENEGRIRFEMVRDRIRSAMNYFLLIAERGIILGQDSNGDHLPAWLTAANLFARRKGWIT
jgi:hypothetical protein